MTIFSQERSLLGGNPPLAARPAWVCAKRGRMMYRKQNKTKAQNIHDRGKESAMSPSQKILPISCSIRSLHHAKVPKNETDQIPGLVLIVALLWNESNRYTRVISTSSIFSVGRRWCCCVGGGGAALTGRSLPYEVSGGSRGGCENPGDSELKLFSLVDGDLGKYWEPLLSGLWKGLVGGWSYSGSGGRV